MADGGLCQGILDSAPLGFVALKLDEGGDDSSLRLLYANHAACEVTGVDLRRSIGRKIGEVLPGTDPARLRAYAQVCKTRKARAVGAVTLTGERGDRSFNVGAFPGPEGSVVIVFESVDHPFCGDPAALDDRREARHLLGKMEAIGRLAGGVAHDFNNVLSVVLSYCDLILDEVEPTASLRRDLEEIQRAGERGATLTRQLLAFSRQQVLQPRVLDLNEVVQGMRRMLERLLGEDIELELRCARRLGQARVDPAQIEQVVMNLVVNARDAMPRGGKLTIETDDVDLDAQFAAGHLGVSPGPHVMLAVSDTGVGMDKETLARIFEPFFTTKEKGKGTGLGLSTAFGIVRQSAGSIWVYSEPGKGATFKVYLPVTQDAPISLPPPAPESQVRGSETVLLVEDEAPVRALAAGILRKYGYRVLEAPTAREAIALAAAQESPVDLLLTDLVLPEMGGPLLAEKLLALRPALRVLFMSGYTDDAVFRHGLLEAGGAFLQKPFVPEALARRVRQVLDG
jgi:signal transduction histidine kinase/CheY-like chemotaxis protein